MSVDRVLVGDKLNICVVLARRSFAYGEASCGELALGCRNREVGDKKGGLMLAPARSNQTGQWRNVPSYVHVSRRRKKNSEKNKYLNCLLSHFTIYCSLWPSNSRPKLTVRQHKYLRKAACNLDHVRSARKGRHPANFPSNGLSITHAACGSHDPTSRASFLHMGGLGSDALALHIDLVCSCERRNREYERTLRRRSFPRDASSSHRLPLLLRLTAIGVRGL